jgi:hypothetical protein
MARWKLEGGASAEAARLHPALHLLKKLTAAPLNTIRTREKAILIVKIGQHGCGSSISAPERASRLGLQLRTIQAGAPDAHYDPARRDRRFAQAQDIMRRLRELTPEPTATG